MNGQKKESKGLACVGCEETKRQDGHLLIAKGAKGAHKYHKTTRIKWTSNIFILVLFVLAGSYLPLVAHASNRIYVNADALFDICMQRCIDGSSLAQLTKNGCEKTCYEMRREFDWLDTSFRNYERCSAKVHDFGVNKDTIIEKKQKWCARFKHIHERKGCLDAVDVFYSAVTEEQICGRGSVVTPVTLNEPAYQPMIEPLPSKAEISALGGRVVEKTGTVTNYDSRAKGTVMPLGDAKKKNLNTKPFPVQKGAKAIPKEKTTATEKSMPMEKDTPYDFSADGKNTATPPTSVPLTVKAGESTSALSASSVPAIASPTTPKGPQNSLLLVPASPQGATAPVAPRVTAPAPPTAFPSPTATPPRIPVEPPTSPTSPTNPTIPATLPSHANSYVTTPQAETAVPSSPLAPLSSAQGAKSKAPVLTLTPIPPQEEQ